MAGARIIVGAMICSLASLAADMPSARADTSDRVAAFDAHRGYSAYESDHGGAFDKAYAIPRTYPDVCAYPDELALAAIVQVATDHGSHASGVIFDNNRVLTAAHAVQGGGRFFVRVGDGFRVADLVSVDHAHDLAVLAVDTAEIQPLRISAGFSPAHAVPVWAAGYPRAQSMKTTMGVFKQIKGGALHTSATIDSGQSGGGLLSCTQGQWSLVGMLRGYAAYWQDDHYVKMDNHSVSVAGTTIHQFLRTYP